jgi:hypothetical protein
VYFNAQDSFLPTDPALIAVILQTMKSMKLELQSPSLSSFLGKKPFIEFEVANFANVQRPEIRVGRIQNEIIPTSSH